jgi:hypothetical protein
VAGIARPSGGVAGDILDRDVHVRHDHRCAQRMAEQENIRSSGAQGMAWTDGLSRAQRRPAKCLCGHGQKERSPVLPRSAALHRRSPRSSACALVCLGIFALVWVQIGLVTGLVRLASTSTAQSPARMLGAGGPILDRKRSSRHDGLWSMLDIALDRQEGIRCR